MVESARFAERVGVALRLAQPLRREPARSIVPAMKTDSRARAPRENRAWSEFSSLPPETQREVLDFIAFLRTRRAPTHARNAGKRPKLAAEAFVGMWRNRRDMRDSTAWVRRVREDEWGNCGPKPRRVGGTAALQ